MSLLTYECLPSNRHSFGFYPDDLLISPAERTLIQSLPNLGTDSLRSALSSFDCYEKTPHIGKDGFQVSMDVQHFAPNEISVTVVDNYVVVDAKHEERRDNHGYISRQFVRRNLLPKGFEAEDVVSTFSSDGVLTIRAPPATPAVKKYNVQHVHIQQTGPAFLSVKKCEEKKSEKKPEEKPEQIIDE